MGRRVCARCRGPLPPAAGVGRPRVYCRLACRKAAYRARARGTTATRSEWWTPPEVLGVVRSQQELGLDAAACEASTAVPDNWLGPKHPQKARRDALAFNNWASLTPPETSVWLNPPYYPPPLLRGFLERAAATAGEGVPVIALVPASTGTSWWHDLVVDAGASVEFLRGRLTFGGPHSTGGPAPWPSALVRFGSF